ncbi:MAG: hypothetical protein KDC82_00055 [Bacteroidetes bacterium]|nr:hypothetical protein [Bacteroidota bacterium]
MFNQMGEMMEIMNELQGEQLNINELNVVTLQKENGVILSLTSPDKDGAKLAKLLAKVMSKFPSMVQAQNPKIKVTYKEA